MSTKAPVLNPNSLNKHTRIAVLGLGYVGLPLAHAFAAHHRTIGYDIDTSRVEEINAGFDRNLDLSEAELSKRHSITYSDDPECLKDADIYIVTAPTPVNSQHQPDLEPVRSATRLIAKYLSPRNIVIFESTVYPGATEEECVPILEAQSELKFNKDFFVGYSPERINPGDKTHTLSKVVKVTSGSTAETADIVDALYAEIIEAGTHRASSIKVAEAAKVIENTQRDLNIALMNELAILFDRLGIDTLDVLEAAGSKWNFLPFRPGLVGGHCIGVDPYYLTYKAHQVNYHPEVILAGRRINDSMGTYVANRLIRLMLSKRMHVIDSRVLILGMTFKENCPDTRNSKVTDVISTLIEHRVNVDVYDPWVKSGESVYLIESLIAGQYDGIIVAVAHEQFANMGIDAIRKLGKPVSVIYDVKRIFPANSVDGSL